MTRLLGRVRGLFAQPTGNPLARFVTMNVMGEAIASVIGFGTSIALARWLGPADRGLLALMLAVSGLALYLTGVGLPWAAVYYATRPEGSPRTILGNGLFHATVLTAVLVPAAWLANEVIADAFGHGRGGMSWVLAAALVPIVFMDWTTHGQLQGMLRFGRYNVLTVLSKAIYAVCVVILVGELGLGVAGGLIATGVLSIVMILGALKTILESRPPRLDLRLYRVMLRYGSRVQIGSIFQQAIARLDIVILQLFRPLSEVGYYVVAQTIGELVLILTGAFQMSVMPLVSHYEGDARQASASADSLRHHGILTAFATLANVVFGSVVILFVYGPRFRPAIFPMLVLLPGVWFMGMGRVIQGDLAGRGRPGLASQLAGLAAGVTIALDFALIPPFGVIGAALASVVAYATYGVASLWALHRVSGIPVRELVVPRRADFTGYGLALRKLFSHLRPTPGGAA
jgi:stage V sporulation protein B